MLLSILQRVGRLLGRASTGAIKPKALSYWEKRVAGPRFHIGMPSAVREVRSRIHQYKELRSSGVGAFSSALKSAQAERLTGLGALASLPYGGAFTKITSGQVKVAPGIVRLMGLRPEHAAFHEAGEMISYLYNARWRSQTILGKPPLGHLSRLPIYAEYKAAAVGGKEELIRAIQLRVKWTKKQISDVHKGLEILEHSRFLKTTRGNLEKGQKLLQDWKLAGEEIFTMSRRILRKVNAPTQTLQQPKRQLLTYASGRRSGSRRPSIVQSSPNMNLGHSTMLNYKDPGLRMSGGLA